MSQTQNDTLVPRNLFSVFAEACEIRPGKCAVKIKKSDTYEVTSYAELLKKSYFLSDFLARAGLKPGERVAILLSNGPFWPVAFFSVVSIQGVAVPIDAQLSPESIKEIIAHARCRWILTEEKFGVALGHILTGLMSCRAIFMDGEDWPTGGYESTLGYERRHFGDHKLAALFYTSGTTQTHKAVMLTHRNLLANFDSVKEVGILKESDILVSILPLHHTYPFMVTCVAPLFIGATVCYVSTVVQNELFSCIRDNRVTIFVGVPQLFALIERSVTDRIKKFGMFAGWTAQRVMDACLGLSKLTGRNIGKVIFKGLHQTLGKDLAYLVTGGAKIEPAVARSFARWGFRVIEGYGLTETSPVVTFNPGREDKFDTIGVPVPGVVVDIVDRNEEGIGEIAVCGDNVMLGYYRLPALTRSVLSSKGFLTGDMGFIDRQGFLHIEGRRDELIVLSSGKKINPEEIEAHYLKNPFIKEICVFSASGSHGDGQLVAVVVPDEDYLRQKKQVSIGFKMRWELEGASQKLPPYQRIKGFVLSKESLPRTRLGKLVRYKITKMYTDGVFKQDERGPEADEKKELTHFEEIALAYISKIIKKTVRLEDHLELDLGLDSLGRIELLSSLQDVVSVGIDDQLALELFQARSVGELIVKAREGLPENAFEGLLKKEDTVFWEQVLKEDPSPAQKAQLKLRFNFFERMVAVLEILLVRGIFKLFYGARIEGKENIPGQGPFVITPNHVTYFDPFFVIATFPIKIVLQMYFVGFGDIFRHPLIAWGMKFHRLVPIDSSLNLADTLRSCRYILANKKVLVYFPEGQRSIDGSLKEFRKGIGILGKESGCPALPVYLEGAYQAWPRTRAYPKLTRVRVKIGKLIEPGKIEAEEDKDPYVVFADAVKKEVSRLKEI